MSYFHFAYPFVFYIFLPLWLILTIYRWKFYTTPVYTYPLTGELSKAGITTRSYHKGILNALYSALLLSLIFLIARPQWVDSRSKVNVEGVDIMITLDVSGSMQLFDDLRDRRQRIAVAKQEAVRFIGKRPDDPIGIVIFGVDAVARCPLTLDKAIVTEIVRSLKLGVIDHRGTSLGTGLAIAASKLKHSKAKSKIIILLTDGRPTPETEKVSVDTALGLAKKFGVKIYTIAIGNRKGGYVVSSFGYVQQAEDSVDETLLQKIATETNGRFFRANNPKEMKQIYNTIDKLEKTEYETNLFARHYEAFSSLIWIALLLLFFYLSCSLFFWRGLL